MEIIIKTNSTENSYHYSILVRSSKFLIRLRKNGDRYSATIWVEDNLNLELDIAQSDIE